MIFERLRLGSSYLDLFMVNPDHPKAFESSFEELGISMFHCIHILTLSLGP